MSDYLIVVVNRACARFFTLEPVEFPELESGPRLMARAEIENSEIKDVQEMYTDSKTGRGAAPQSGSVHGYVDKRDQHLDELRRRFAVRVLERMQKLASTERASTVILAVSAQALVSYYVALHLQHERPVVGPNFTPMSILLLPLCGLLHRRRKISQKCYINSISYVGRISVPLGYRTRLPAIWMLILKQPKCFHFQLIS